MPHFHNFSFYIFLVPKGVSFLFLLLILIFQTWYCICSFHFFSAWNWASLSLFDTKWLNCNWLFFQVKLAGKLPMRNDYVSKKESIKGSWVKNAQITSLKKGRNCRNIWRKCSDFTKYMLLYFHPYWKKIWIILFIPSLWCFCTCHITKEWHFTS